MNGDFAKALPRILVYEGGKVDNPRDPGGRTNKGITQATYNSFCREYGRPHRDVYEISMDEVATIYKDRYWDEVGGDELPAGLDLCVFDGGVNSGPSHSIIWLQQALGDGYQGAVDGRLGSKTLQAIQDHGDVDGLIEAYCSHRLATLERLKTWGEFGKGWHARIANCQKTGEAWADGSAAPYPVDVSDAGGHMKAPIAGNIKPLPVSQISTHVVSTASAGGAAVTQASQGLTPIADTFSWMKYVLGGLAIAGVVAGFLVKIATDAKTSAEKGASSSAVNLEADTAATRVPVNDNAPPALSLIASPTPPAPRAPKAA